jgi:hypothetical protein
MRYMTMSLQWWFSISTRISESSEESFDPEESFEWDEKRPQLRAAESNVLKVTTL